MVDGCLFHGLGHVEHGELHVDGSGGGMCLDIAAPFMAQAYMGVAQVERLIRAADLIDAEKIKWGLCHLTLAWNVFTFSLSVTQPDESLMTKGGFFLTPEEMLRRER